MEKNKRYNKIIAFFLSFIILIGVFLFLKSLKETLKPNILLITLDGLRDDHLGCYGYKRDTSPNIDKIAEGGVLFLNAIAQSSHTAPCMYSILTSTYPSECGVFNFGDKISEKIPTLSYLLEVGGYKTGFFSSHVGIATIRGFDEHFDTFYSIWTSREDYNNKSIKVTEINPRIIKWIEKNKKEKFFLWIHYLEPHYPMNPPLTYTKLFLDGNYNKAEQKVKISDDYVFGFGGIPRRLANPNNDITDLNYYISLYDATIRYADEQIGKLIKYLKEMNLDRKTVIIISSDHGESLGEHDLYFTHGFQLYEGLIKVPLIIKDGTSSPKKGKIMDQVQQIDIAPTILEILKIKKPSSMVGTSLIPLIKENDDYNREYAFSFLGTDKISIRTNEWKLIYTFNNKEYELYNLKDDPGELSNIVSVEKEKFEFLKQILDRYIDETINTRKEKTKIFLEEDEKERLRFLGYVQ